MNEGLEFGREHRCMSESDEEEGEERRCGCARMLDSV